jgi:hypothetical protein
MNKIRMSQSDFAQLINKSVKKVLKEEMGNEFDYNNEGESNMFGEQDEEFTPHGSYTVSNSGGYEVMLSDDGEMARVKDGFGSDNPEISDWLPIEYVETGEEDEDGFPSMDPVIDPDGYNIPLNQVMRMNQFESKKPNKIKVKLSELRRIIQDTLKEEMRG